MESHSCTLLCFVLLMTLSAEVWSTNLPPSFTKDLNNLVLPESTAVGSVIFTLEGTDPENSPVYYGLTGTDVLQVNSNTGDVTVVKPLDHEVNDTLNFFVTIEDVVDDAPVGKNNVVTVPVTVIISDENDNAPVFQNVPYVVTINEDASLDSTVFSGIAVTDNDTVGDSLEVECENVDDFSNVCDIFQVVSIESAQNTYRGGLVLTTKLNYKTQQEYHFILHATDGELGSATPVTVKINDVQDTPPVFTSDLKAEIFENASINTLVLTVHAEDGDTGMPRKISYELVQNPMNYFLIDPSTGEIRTAKPLDKEAVVHPNGVVYLSVAAKELINGNKGNDLSTMTTVEIPVTIKDVNDEPPSFNHKEYTAEVSEDTDVGFVLPNLDMFVRDPDDGINSVFSLTLQDISHVFSIEPKIVNGSSPVIIKINNNSLDYEDVNQRKFIVLVIAKELYTENQLSSTATLTVIVNDANDNAPQFPQYSYNAQVSETALGGTYVTTIVAHDRDSGKFGEEGIVYQLLGIGADKFVVNNRTGVITVATCPTPGSNDCLDYEATQEYSFSYKATDDDGKGQTTVTPLTIALLDNNDNPPKFSQKVYNIHIPEGSFKFDPELIMQATDLDRTSHVVYSIVGENSDGLFSIDQDTGKIRITSNRALVYHNIPEANMYYITIEANDGKFSDTAHVQIAVTDVNNHAPVFEEMNYLASIPEDADFGTSIVTLRAKDGDYGLNGEVIYTMKKGALNDFEINSETGVVTVASKLDFDRRNTYYIEVEAIDKGDVSLQGSTLLTIYVNNTNNKPPYFVPTVQKAETTKDAKIGTVVHTLVAIDPDINTSESNVLNFAATEPITAIDKYGKIVLKGGFRDFFSVDKHTGKVSVASVLQRDLAAIINITVLVTDTTAQHVQQGEGNLIITITDINDHPPQFQPPWSVEKPEYYLQLQEELPIGTTVATYTAFDDDSSIAGYTIIPDSKYFKINNGTGILQTKERIDYEKIAKLNFTVVAYDSGIPQLNTSATVFVTILNINDNSPKFFQSDYNATVLEHAANNTSIITVNAKDMDAGDYGIVTYSLTGEHSENFRISPQTGEIFVANSNFLDHEVLNETVIQVVANDNAPARLKHSVTVPVRISILDINDNAPKFNQSSYNVTIRENILYNPPVPIVQVFATDIDEGNHGHINYRIVSGNKNGEFLLGADTGIIYTHKSLLGKLGENILEIEARDGVGNGNFADKTTVNIFVGNSNQHTPTFIVPSSLNSTVEITQHAAVANYSIMTVTAMDKDIGNNGKISYHLQVNGSNVQETNGFIIDADTGELKINHFLDREVRDHYNLILVARDNGTPIWHEMKCYLTVVLINTNENIPEFPNSRNNDNPYHFFVTENSHKNTLVGQVKAHLPISQNSVKIYYYLISGNENNEFHLSKLDGNLYTNAVFDREAKTEYNLLVLANSEPDFYFRVKESNAVLTNDTIFDGSVAKIKVTINDVNDNPPQFEKIAYYAAVNSMVDLNKFVINVSAVDRDFGANATFYYYIKTSNLYKFESNQSSGSVIPSPFNISEAGELFTATSLMENNQNRFIIDVKAKEIAEPEREGSTNVFVWIFEPSQLIRIILSRPVKKVLQEQESIVTELSNITNYLVIIDEVRDHLSKSGRIDPNWSDMYILVVELKTQQIVPVFDVLKIIDGKYDYLKDYYQGVGIENVIPAYALESEDSFDPALSALIALLLVLIVGIITFTVVCCCLRNWSISSNSMKKKDALINKAVIDDLNTTENPLWIEQKLKIYEEQELSMQVFNEPDQAMLQRKSSRELLTDENAYATIQHPNRRGTALTATLSLGDDVEDYATLSRIPYSSNTLNGSLRGTINYYETAMGFHGSTFQVPDSSEANNDCHEYAPYRNSPDNSISHEYVAELI